MKTVLLLALTIAVAPTLRAQAKPETTVVNVPLHRTPNGTVVTGPNGKPLVPVPQRPDTGYTMKDPPNLIAKEAFSVPRGADGRCEWMQMSTTRRPKPITESAYAGEKHESTCKGVMFFVSIPKEYQTGGDSLKPGPDRSVSASFASHIWEGPDTLSGRGRELRDIVNLVLPHVPANAKVNEVAIHDERRAGVKAFLTPTSGIGYTLEKRNGRWVLLPGQTAFGPPR
jgi:hypothetical protein